MTIETRIADDNLERTLIPRVYRRGRDLFLALTMDEFWTCFKGGPPPAEITEWLDRQPEAVEQQTRGGA